MSLQIKYIDAPEGAQDNMKASGDRGNVISDISLIAKGDQNIPWATLEPGVWSLDGTRMILADSPKVAWWSSKLSDDNGLFTVNPVLILSFSAPYTATGITFTFSPSTNQWCRELKASWYNGETLLAEGTYYPDAPSWVLERTVESFDQIRIELIATNKPKQFAKLQSIEVGHTILFGKEELISVQILNEIDPSLCELTADTISFEIYDKQSRNLIPQENQRLEVTKNGSLYAVQYIKSSTRESKDRYYISGQSAIGLLEDTFLGGLYTGKPLRELLREVLGEWEFDLDPSFDSMTITGYIPICAQREALQQISFAIGAIVTTQGSSKIRFVPPAESVTSVLGESDVFQGSKMKTSPRIARVEVFSHSYTEAEDVENLIKDEEIDGEDVLLTFSEPHHEYFIIGGTINSFDVNWVKITASGPVTITAKKYTHNTVSHTKRNPSATAKEQGNFISVSGATLINSKNAKQALERLYKSSQMRQSMQQEAVITSQKVGDMASSISPWGTEIRGFISSMDSLLTQNGHTASIKIIGAEFSPVDLKLQSNEKEVLY